MMPRRKDGKYCRVFWLLLLMTSFPGIILMLRTAQPNCSVPHQTEAFFSSFIGPSSTVSVVERESQLAAPLNATYLVPNDVFYIWCGAGRHFEFRHYISVLSAIRYLHPDKVVMYFDHEPTVDKYYYNVWLSEIENKYPFFSKQHLPAACHNESHGFIWDQLTKYGGVYVHFDVILAQPVHKQRTAESFVALDAAERRVVQMKAASLNQSTKTEPISATCVDSTKLSATDIPVCVTLGGALLPKDIWDLDSPLGRLLRTVAYGKPELAKPAPSYDTLVPNIGHVVWIGGGEIKFDFYLCILSLLHVALVEAVYVHGDLPPTGFYWNLLEKDSKVRFVRRAISPSYGNTAPTKNRAHVADIWRIDIMRVYGGIYLDNDAMMVKPLTREIRGYEAVATKDINTCVYTLYPDHINLGVSIGKPGSSFWRFYQRASKWFVEGDHFWLGVRVPYKIKELHPDSLLVDPQLQVLCYESKCRPTWQPDYQKGQVNHLTRPDILKNWKNDTFAYHFTWPEPGEFSSPEALLAANGLLADIGRYVLEKSAMLEFFRKKNNTNNS